MPMVMKRNIPASKNSMWVVLHLEKLLPFSSKVRLHFVQESIWLSSKQNMESIAHWRFYIRIHSAAPADQWSQSKPFDSLVHKTCIPSVSWLDNRKYHQRHCTSSRWLRNWHIWMKNIRTCLIVWGQDCIYIYIWNSVVDFLPNLSYCCFGIADFSTTFIIDEGEDTCSQGWWICIRVDQYIEIITISMFWFLTVHLCWARNPITRVTG